MAEKPRSFLPPAKEGGGGSAKSHCGTCGLPSKDCLCSSYKPWGVEGATRPGTPVEEKMPAKFGSGNKGD